MNTTEQFLRDFNSAWLKEDISDVLGGVTEDIRFRMAGEKGVEGKADFAKMLKEMSGSGQGFDLKVDRVIINGDQAALTGQIVCRPSGNAKTTTYAFCDVYVLQPGKQPKVRDLTAYIMEVKATGDH